jgi:hypothetical protein
MTGSEVFRRESADAIGGKKMKGEEKRKEESEVQNAI